MPEVRFTVRWPDGTEETCYSPSTAIARHLEAGARYQLADFLARARAGLREGSRRVEAKYGFACSSALDQLARIEARAARFDRGDVLCLSLS
ncbi:MSMEG_0570 family nitrogen starvation response protein [Amaricoccus solimangrovi]|uniref:MSMEG_0570 family nitrogen starvation response protein n=1 Tax=Amaricoccus solimangrovi TaxID=2589815 RepID=A0A501WU63_9RHOB|nr:MSMEG_0570 family nitrogen starvation response protein [Amaricoccus solimangrovi]TPE51694.1 MSMEG_0570 family nitrogen starvation response protein [Amaricoccus solimangrovi]